MKSSRLNSGMQNRIIIFDDIIFHGIRASEFKNEIKMAMQISKLSPAQTLENFYTNLPHR